VDKHPLEYSDFVTFTAGEGLWVSSYGEVDYLHCYACMWTGGEQDVEEISFNKKDWDTFVFSPSDRFTFDHHFRNQYELCDCSWRPNN